LCITDENCITIKLHFLLLKITNDKNNPIRHINKKLYLVLGESHNENNTHNK